MGDGMFFYLGKSSLICFPCSVTFQGPYFINLFFRLKYPKTVGTVYI